MENTPIEHNLTLVTGGVSCGKTTVAMGLRERFGGIVLDEEAVLSGKGKVIRSALKGLEQHGQVFVTSERPDILKRVGFKKRAGRIIHIELAKELPE